MSLFTNLQDPILSLYNYILRQIYILTCNIIYIYIYIYIIKSSLMFTDLFMNILYLSLTCLIVEPELGFEFDLFMLDK